MKQVHMLHHVKLFNVWIIIYFAVEYSYSTIKGPILLTCYGGFNSFTSPIQNLTYMELGPNQMNEMKTQGNA